MRSFILVLLALQMAPESAQANLRVLATVPDLAALVKEVGGDEVAAESIAKGTQDPHFLEAKPSFMVKVSKADLVVAAGLSLEVGWLPLLLRGARNPKVMPGEKGYLELGPNLDPIDVAKGKITRAEGDVHPEGNPHFWLDPVRMGRAAGLVAAKLGELDPSKKEEFSKRAEAFAARMKKKTEEWKARIDKSGVRKVITYHSTLNYFFERFGISNPAFLEPKPGIPPTSAHLVEVLGLMKKENIKLLLVENYFDVSMTRKLTQEVPGSRAVSVAVSVGGIPKMDSSDELYEQLVKAIEGK